MPNWVYNGLTIEGNPEQVNKLVAQVGKSFTVPVQTMDMGDVLASGGFPTKIEEVVYTKPIFAFWNIIAPTDLDTYIGQPKRSELDPNDPNWWVDTQKVSLTDDSWYNWNTRNWGVKWDVAVSDENKYPETYMEGPTENGENLVVYYNFNTPWGIAEEALTKLSSQYPNLLFTLSYEEETGWGGEHEYLRGERQEGSEYNWKCRDCDYEEMGEPPYCEECEYDMCPSCGYGEPDERCQTHSVQLDSTEKADA